jgi:hypothetical protein
MAEVTIQGEKGGALVIVHQDGTSDVWEIPEGSTVDVSGQRGFGDAGEEGIDFSSTDALAKVALLIGRSGAL